LRHRLHRAEPLETPDVVLAGLVDAIGLSPQVLWGTNSSTASFRDHLVSLLPAPLRALIAETRAAVGNAVLTHRA
jgi:hypothetical protein